MCKFYVECGDFRWCQNIHEDIIMESLEELQIDPDTGVEQVAMQMAVINAFNYWMDKYEPSGDLKMGPEVYADQRGYRNDETADDNTIVVETANVMESIQEMYDLEEED
jgi:hypothetical protein